MTWPRRRTTATAVLGIALVVFVLAGALMLTAGIRRTLGSTGRADGALVIRRGSDAELSSNIDQATVGLILEGPEVRRTEKGASLALGVVKFSMINFATWSEIVFVFQPTPQILAIAMVSAVGMGVLGGFLPAVRAARLRPVEAMRGE